jgi:cytochrome c oxidase assembly factor CtaG
MAPLIQAALELWKLPVSLTLTIVFTALLYLRGWLHLRSTSLNVIPAWRASSFLLGLWLTWVAVASPIAALDEELLTVHMVQHLLLMTIAPPLIWLGAPVIPVLHGLPRRFVHRVIGPLFRWPPLQRLGRALAQPAFCWFAAAGVLVGWHVPAAFTFGLHSEAWHAVEHASFLGTGLLFWWPVIQPWPTASNWSEWSILLYLFLATLPCDILSGFLVFCDRVVYPAYFSSSQLFGLPPLQDQQCAGALMWTCVTVVYLIAGTIVTARLLSPNRLRQYSISKLDSQPSTAAPQTTRQSTEAA